MHKTTKALIAAGAATVLMLGGGSLAYWQTSRDFGATRFQTGYISFDSKETKWFLNGEEISSHELSNRFLVPGDVIVYEDTMFVEGQGDNLYLAADVTLGGLTATPLNSDDLDERKTAAINGVIAPTYTFTGDDGATVYPTDEPDVFGIDLDTTIGDLHLTITLEWPGSDDDHDTMDAEVTLASTGITVRQVPAPLESEEN